MSRPLLHATIVALLLLTVGAAGATAKRLLTGADIQNGSITGADIKDSSLRGKDIRNGSLTGADIKNGSITEKDIAPGILTGGGTDTPSTGTPGPQGPAGPAGPQGPAAPIAPAYSARFIEAVPYTSIATAHVPAGRYLILGSSEVTLAKFSTSSPPVCRLWADGTVLRAAYVGATAGGATGALQAVAPVTSSVSMHCDATSDSGDGLIRETEVTAIPVSAP